MGPRLDTSEVRSRWQPTILGCSKQRSPDASHLAGRKDNRAAPPYMWQVRVTGRAVKCGPRYLGAREANDPEGPLMSRSSLDSFFACAVGCEPFPHQRRLAEAHRFPNPLHGKSDSDWRRPLERDTVLIGTRDMLLSQALSRGYVASRSRWPGNSENKPEAA